MCVMVCDVNALMSHTVGNRQRRESHIDQKGNMRMPQPVYFDAFDASLLAATLHFSGIKLQDLVIGKIRSFGCTSYEQLDVILHFSQRKDGICVRHDCSWAS